MLDAALSLLSGSAVSGLEAALLCLKIITAIFAVICLITTISKIAARRKKKAAVSGGVLFLSYLALAVSLVVTLLAGALVAKKRGASVPATLDELSAPGMLAVLICRLGEWGTGEGVGAWIESEGLMRLPFAVMNEYEEWQLAVFLFEAAAALVILLRLLRVKQGSGERMLSALLLYACCQVVLESMRMDSCLKIGFVRVSQVISAVMILAVTLVRARSAGGNAVMIRRGAFVALGTAVVGGLEWALDKTPVSNVLIYAVMIAVCAGFAANGACFAQRKEA